MRSEKPSSVPSPEALDSVLLEWVASFYHNALLATPQGGVGILAGIGINSSEYAVSHRVGFSNRTLGPQLSGIEEGRRIRARLQALGVFKTDTGHEFFNGRLVVPTFDATGSICQLHGIRLGREGAESDLSLPGKPHGIVNLASLKPGEEWLLFVDPFDALCAIGLGLTASTAIGSELSQDFASIISERKPRRVVLVLGSDPVEAVRGESLTRAIAVLGTEITQVLLRTSGLLRDFVKTVSEPVQAFRTLMDAAKSGKKPTQEPTAAGSISVGPSPVGVAVLKHDPTELLLGIGDRTYRVRGLRRNTGYEALKVSLRVARGDSWHLDTVDLAQAKQRTAFVSASADETGIGLETLKHDLGRVLLKLEEIHEAYLQAQVAPNDASPPMTETERESALELLRSPDLWERISEHAAQCGIAGERTNVQAGYLGAVSRLLDRPLALVVQSSSAAGKTTLMDAILAFMPPESRQRYSAVTGQSLFYLGRGNLRHKILAIAEQEGAEKAAYALKLLQSEGELRLAATGKAEETGRTETQAYVVTGPTMIFLTTTAPLLDEELQNRCIVLTVDESREQTERIHSLQREARTEAGLARKVRREEILSLHRNAQRLLEPLPVFNPYADRLRFLSDQLRTRRDHEKYLLLIDAMAVLFQHQRDRKRIAGCECIVASLDDIERANALSHEILGRGLDDTPPQAKRLLGLIQKMRDAGGEVLWRRRDLRSFTGWSDTALKVHLKRLVELEYVLPRRDSKLGYRYELLFDGDLSGERPHLSGLIDLGELRKTNAAVQWSALNGARSGQIDARSGSGQPPVSHPSGAGPVPSSL